MTKSRLLLLAFYIAGLLGAAVFVITKSESLMYHFTAAMYDDGDLYRFAKVRHFKVPMPAPVAPDEDAEPMQLDTVSLFIIGDSFIEANAGHPALPLQLSSALHVPIHAVQAGESTAYFNPLYLFKKGGVTRGKPRLVILERVERYIIDEFGYPLDDDPDIATSAESVVKSDWEIVQRRWFADAEKNYQIFLTSSSVTSPVIELWNTAMFSLLGRISEKTPVYSLNPPFLFYDEEVTHDRTCGFYYPHPDSLIDTIAGNLAQLRDILKERYNTDLMFMPIPNPYTLYHTFINSDPYDQFLPRLEKALNKRGVATVDLYEPFKASKEILYFPTDSHWNADGVNVALRVLMETMKRTNDKR
jgi:hypothetical protein